MVAIAIIKATSADAYLSIFHACSAAKIYSPRFVMLLQFCKDGSCCIPRVWSLKNQAGLLLYGSNLKWMPISCRVKLPVSFTTTVRAASWRLDFAVSLWVEGSFTLPYLINFTRCFNTRQRVVAYPLKKHLRREYARKRARMTRVLNCLPYVVVRGYLVAIIDMTCRIRECLY
jgi:hypothetical protein